MNPVCLKLVSDGTFMFWLCSDLVSGDPNKKCFGVADRGPMQLNNEIDCFISLNGILIEKVKVFCSIKVSTK